LRAILAAAYCESGAHVKLCSSSSEAVVQD
jgi:hypothetical protein